MLGQGGLSAAVATKHSHVFTIIYGKVDMIQSKDLIVRSSMIQMHQILNVDQSYHSFLV